MTGQANLMECRRVTVDVIYLDFQSITLTEKVLHTPKTDLKLKDTINGEKYNQLMIVNLNLLWSEFVKTISMF